MMQIGATIASSYLPTKSPDGKGKPFICAGLRNKATFVVKNNGNLDKVMTEKDLQSQLFHKNSPVTTLAKNMFYVFANRVVDTERIHSHDQALDQPINQLAFNGKSIGELNRKDVNHVKVSPTVAKAYETSLHIGKIMHPWTTDMQDEELLLGYIDAVADESWTGITDLSPACIEIIVTALKNLISGSSHGPMISDSKARHILNEIMSHIAQLTNNTEDTDKVSLPKSHNSASSNREISSSFDTTA